MILAPIHSFVSFTPDVSRRPWSLSGKDTLLHALRCIEVVILKEMAIEGMKGWTERALEKVIYPIR